MAVVVLARAAEAGEEALGARASPARRAAAAGSPSAATSARSSPRPGEGPEHLDLQRRRGDQQAGGERVGRVRRPRLPRGDHRRRVVPERLERGHLRRGHGRELERRDDAEARPARAAQRPEQVGLVVLVAAHRAPSASTTSAAPRVRGQPVEAAEDPEAAAEREPGDADGRAAAGRDRDAVGVERVVDVAEQRAGADRARPSATATASAATRRSHARGRGAPREAVPAAADRERQPGGRAHGRSPRRRPALAARDGHRGPDVLKRARAGRIRGLNESDAKGAARGALQSFRRSFSILQGGGPFVPRPRSLRLRPSRLART